MLPQIIIVIPNIESKPYILEPCGGVEVALKGTIRVPLRGSTRQGGVCGARHFKDSRGFTSQGVPLR